MSEPKYEGYVLEILKETVWVRLMSLEEDVSADAEFYKDSFTNEDLEILQEGTLFQIFLNPDLTIKVLRHTEEELARIAEIKKDAKENYSDLFEGIEFI